MPLLDIFRKDKKYWTPQQIQEVQLFFTITPFFSPYYEHQDFNTVTGFTFYAKIWALEQLALNVNKKSQIIILLQGDIEIFQPMLGKQLRKLKKRNKEILHQNYGKVGDYCSRSEVIEIKSDAIIRSKEDTASQIIFVPSMLHQSYVKIVKARRIDAVMSKLTKVFQTASKLELRSLAEHHCIFKQYKMNNYIYRAGYTPKYCYIVIKGQVKIDSPGFQAKKMMEMAIISQNTIFGQNDLNQEFRLQNALCCSAQCQVLEIQKEAFNKFMLKNPTLNPVYAQKMKQLRRRKNKSTIDDYSQKFSLPRIQRFHSFVKPEEEDRIQKQLVQNCHMLINLSPKKRVNSSFRLPEHTTSKDYSVNPFENKVSYFKRRKSSNGSLDLSNKFF